MRLLLLRLWGLRLLVCLCRDRRESASRVVCGFDPPVVPERALLLRPLVLLLFRCSRYVVGSCLWWTVHHGLWRLLRLLLR